MAKKKSKRTKKPKRSTLVKKLDRLFSAVIHKRDEGQCQMCGQTSGRMNCSHIYHKDCSALRFDMTNAIVKCVRCHKFGMLAWHSSPLSAAIRFIRKFSARVEYLHGFEEREQLVRKWTVDELLAVEQRLKEKLEEINS
jgi:hypothetical protein